MSISGFPYSGCVRITTKERTVIDSIKDVDRIAGIEEVIADIEGLTGLKEDLLLKHLEENDSRFLYQKAGFLLYPLRRNLGISENFFDICKSVIGQSKRYLLKEMSDGIYDNAWQLIVPHGIFQLKNGEKEYDRI